MSHSFPILEFDPQRDAVIEPAKVIKHRDVPEYCVICFFKEIIESVKDQLECEALPPFKTEMGEIQVFSGRYEGQTLAIVPSPVGAPLAAGCREEIIARGGRKFIVSGGAGVLDQSIGSGDIVVPTSAIRDEGTSYHYLAPSREVHPSPLAVEAIIQTLDLHGCSYTQGMTWTTDAFYRETKAKVAKRKSEGCITVEMEAAAFFAVAQFRGVQIGQLLYGGDDVGGIEWDPREFGQKISAREELFWLAVEACLRL